VCGVQDVLINNAGVVSGKTLLENTPRAMNLTMQVNTISHFWTVRKLLPG
jgi:all-trans-retinol dehydrogenase (NAD+)